MPEIEKTNAQHPSKKEEKMCEARKVKDREKRMQSGLIKNVQMQGTRNPDEGGVHRSTPQRGGMRVTQQMGVFHQPAMVLDDTSHGSVSSAPL